MEGPHGDLPLPFSFVPSHHCVIAFDIAIRPQDHHEEKSDPTLAGSRGAGEGLATTPVRSWVPVYTWEQVPSFCDTSECQLLCLYNAENKYLQIFWMCTWYLIRDW